MNAAVTLTDRGSAAQQIAEHVTQFIRQGEEFAEISLNPPHLGKIRAQITVTNDQASVILTTVVPDIRDVLESSIPRLSNLLSNAGLSLADARVMQDMQQQQNFDEPSDNPREPQMAMDEGELQAHRDADAHDGNELAGSLCLMVGILTLHPSDIRRLLAAWQTPDFFLTVFQ